MIGDTCYTNFFAKHQISNLISPEDKENYENSKARIIRNYMIFVSFVHALQIVIGALVGDIDEMPAKIWI